MNALRTSLAVAAASAALVFGVAQAGAAVVGVAPPPIPADVPAGPPPVAALASAGDTSPPAGQIADPITAGASCTAWYRQSAYGERWPVVSTWWEYRCTYDETVYYPDPCGTGGGGACQPVCYGYPFNCFWVSQDWTDYFYWDGAEPTFYGQLASSAAYDDSGVYWSSAYWWDVSASQWYRTDAHVLTVSKQGSGTGLVSSSPAVIDCGSTCQATVDAGTSVTLTATPDTSSVFTGWAGDCSGTGTCQVTMDQTRSVIATFEPKQFTLTLATAGTGSGLVVAHLSQSATGCRTCALSFDVGTPVTLTPEPDTTSVFTGWSGDCSGTGSCQVTMDQARSVTATFALSTLTLTVSRAGTGSARSARARRGSAAATPALRDSTPARP